MRKAREIFTFYADYVEFLGEKLVCIGELLPWRTRNMHLRDAKTGKIKKTIEVNPVGTHEIYPNPQNGTWIHCSFQGVVKIHDADLNLPPVLFRVEEGTHVVDLDVIKTQQDQAIVSFDENNYDIHRISLLDGRTLQIYPRVRYESGTRFVCSTDSFFFIEENTAKRVFSMNIQSGERSVFCTTDDVEKKFCCIKIVENDLLVIGEDHGGMQLWDAKTRQFIGRFSRLFTDGVEAIFDLADGLHIAVTCESETEVYVFNIITRDMVAIVDAKIQNGKASAFSTPGGRYAAVCTDAPSFDLVETNFPFIVHETGSYQLTSYGQVFSKPQPPAIIGTLAANNIEAAAVISPGSAKDVLEWRIAVRAVRDDLAIRASERRSKNKEELINRAKFNLIQHASSYAPLSQRLVKDVTQIIGNYL